MIRKVMMALLGETPHPKDHPLTQFSSGALDLRCEFALPGGGGKGQESYIICFDVVEPTTLKSANCFMEIYSEESDTDDFRRKKRIYPQSSLTISYDESLQIAGVLYLSHPRYLHFISLMAQLLITNVFTMRLLIEETRDYEFFKSFTVSHVLLPEKPSLTRRISFFEKVPEGVLLN